MKRKRDEGERGGRRGRGCDQLTCSSYCNVTCLSKCKKKERKIYQTQHVLGRPLLQEEEEEVEVEVGEEGEKHQMICAIDTRKRSASDVDGNWEGKRRQQHPSIRPHDDALERASSGCYHLFLNGGRTTTATTATATSESRCCVCVSHRRSWPATTYYYISTTIARASDYHGITRNDNNNSSSSSNGKGFLFLGHREQQRRLDEWRRESL